MVCQKEEVMQAAMEGLFLDKNGSVHLTSLSRITTHTTDKHMNTTDTSESAHFLATDAHTVFQWWI